MVALVMIVAEWGTRCKFWVMMLGVLCSVLQVMLHVLRVMMQCV